MTKTIQVSDEVHTYLEKQGRKGESFDEVLRRLLHL
jgi:predicted CopG family antitoxin